MAHSTATEHSAKSGTSSLINLLEGLSDPTVLLTRSLRILFANAAARMRFSRVSFSVNDRFDVFLMTAFPSSNVPDVRKQMTGFLEGDTSRSETVFLHETQQDTYLRLAAIDCCSSHSDTSLMPALAVTFFDPDPEISLPQLELVLDSSTDGVFIVNRDNRIVYFNSACERLTGWRRGRAVMETYECANVLRCHTADGESMGSESLCPAKLFFNRASTPVPHEMLITTQGGKERWIETNYSPIRGASGEVEFIVGIMRDIDERKRLEAQLVQNRNLAMMGQLVSGVAHEIKNPLGIMMTSVDIITDPSRPESQRQEAASYIREEVRRLDDRVTDFLAFARPKPLIAEPVDLNTLISQVVVAYAALRNPRFTAHTRLDAAAPVIDGDPDQLYQVFLNLVINADQAMPQGGVLEVSTVVIEDEVRLAFADHGFGIRPSDLSKIFDPFFTTKKDGTGLGLSIVHQILTTHRGRISVRNNEGAPGITVEIVLPLSAAATAEPA